MTDGKRSETCAQFFRKGACSEGTDNVPFRVTAYGKHMVPHHSKAMGTAVG